MNQEFTIFDMRQAEALAERVAERAFEKARDELFHAAPEVMTQKEVCQYLGVSSTTVIEKAKTAGLPVSYMLGEKSPRYIKAEIDKWLKGSI
jgi:excisionase family DNA binding protein